MTPDRAPVATIDRPGRRFIRGAVRTVLAQCLAIVVYLGSTWYRPTQVERAVDLLVPVLGIILAAAAFLFAVLVAHRRAPHAAAAAVAPYSAAIVVLVAGGGRFWLFVAAIAAPVLSGAVTATVRPPRSTVERGRSGSGR